MTVEACLESAGPGAAVELAVCDVFALKIGGRPVDLTASKARALLVYLLLEPRQHLRTDLAALLWPRLPQQRALHNLSGAWVALRQAFGAAAAALIMNRSRLMLDRRAVVLDLDEYDRAAALLQQHPHRRAENCPACRLTAQQLVRQRSSLLLGFAARGCDAYNTWLEQQRAQRRNVLLHALQFSAEAALADGDASRAAESLQRAMFLAPWDEALLRRYLTLLAQTGRTAQALFQMDDYRLRLMSQRRQRPAVETEQLLMQIRRRELPPLKLAGVPQRATAVLHQPAVRAALTEITRIDRRLVTMIGGAALRLPTLLEQLAAAAAPAYDGGTVTLDLTTVSDAAQAWPLLAAACGCADGWAALRSALDGREVLLLLALGPQSAALRPLIERVLLQTRGAVVLAAADQPLGLAGETVLTWPELSSTVD